MKINRERLAHTVREIKTLNDLNRLSFDLDFINLCNEEEELGWIDAQIIEAVYDNDPSLIYDIKKDLLKML